jgi:hypothetical protein
VRKTYPAISFVVEALVPSACLLDPGLAAAEHEYNLPPPPAGTEDSSQDSANELPADLAARGAHRALRH